MEKFQTCWNYQLTNEKQKRVFWALGLLGVRQGQRKAYVFKGLKRSPAPLWVVLLSLWTCVSPYHRAFAPAATSLRHEGVHLKRLLSVNHPSAAISAFSFKKWKFQLSFRKEGYLWDVNNMLTLCESPKPSTLTWNVLTAWKIDAQPAVARGGFLSCLHAEEKMQGSLGQLIACQGRSLSLSGRENWRGLTDLLWVASCQESSVSKS